MKTLGVFIPIVWGWIVARKYSLWYENYIYALVILIINNFVVLSKTGSN